MAKPIEATPTLRGKEAIDFIKRMLEEERNPSKKRIKMLEEARKAKFNWKF
jgi:hypothetical protein